MADSNSLESVLKIVAALQAGTLLSVIVYGWKILSFFAEIKTKTDLMWTDYETRKSHPLFYHRRSSDDIANDSEQSE